MFLIRNFFWNSTKLWTKKKDLWQHLPALTIWLYHVIVMERPLSFVHRLAVLCRSRLWELRQQFHGSHWCACVLHIWALFVCTKYTDQDAGERDWTQRVPAGHVPQKVEFVWSVIDFKDCSRWGYYIGCTYSCVLMGCFVEILMMASSSSQDWSRWQQISCLDMPREFLMLLTSPSPTLFCFEWIPFRKR